jgi:DNA-binding response OmpR family regulator
MYHILVIEDEKDILDILEIILLKAGYKVETALDGQKGIKKFDNGQFDLVITDINMPGLDGRKVVEHIRNSDRPCTPIIGISGTPWLLENIPLDAVFKKPFPPQDLVSSTRHLIMQVGSDCDLS